jgi:phage tail-like protein
MSCGAGTPTFRLLDAYVGWDTAEVTPNADSIIGWNDPGGIQLAPEAADAIDPNQLVQYIPPPRLARSCDPCEWYLITPQPSRLMKRNPCSGCWEPAWDEPCDPKVFVNPTAVAVRGRYLAISDLDANSVWIRTRGGERLTASIHIGRPGAMAFTSWGELLVVSRGTKIFRFDFAGARLGRLKPPAGTIESIAVSDDCRIWVVTRDREGYMRLWKRTRTESEFSPATLADLAKAFSPTIVSRTGDAGFCLTVDNLDGVPMTCCYSWYGRPIDECQIPPLPTPGFQRHAIFNTEPIDSGIPRCRWHRVRIDADVPSGTTIEAVVATNESPDSPPHESDWSPTPPARQNSSGSFDFLIDQPPGRYLFFRLRLSGDGRSTPIVRRVRLDFPRVTSLENLPPIYRERPEAEDFTERFLSLFDATISEVDTVIERAPALLDATGVPDSVLPWLGSFLDVTFDRGWTPQRMRRVMRSVPSLYRRRGTPHGLADAVKLIFDVEPVIQELPAERNWAAVGERSQLGSLRLYGRSLARLRLGNSELGRAPIRSFGDPDVDPLLEHAYRFRVLIPPRTLDENERERLERLIADLKPAHTVASVRVGGTGFLLGSLSAVGIDTGFGALPPPILGKTIRLRRASVVWHGPGGKPGGITPDRMAVVGASTIME